MSRLAIISAVLVAGLAANAHAVGQLTDVSIYDRSAGGELPIYQYNGKYFVAGKPGNEYQITLRSQSQRDVLGVVSVDGVNVVNGDTAAVNQSGYVMSPYQQTEIKGWRKSTDRVARFYFTELPDSYAARTDRPDDVGVIGVAVFRRKIEEPEYHYYDPRDDQSSRGAPGNMRRYGDGERGMEQKAQPQHAPSVDSYRSQIPQPDDKLGTGHGRSERSKVRQVEFERESSRPNEIINIYYDSYQNLVAAGVIPQEHYGHSRPPRAFPGNFVPDPWRW
ncbi:MAG: hypothetical protein ABIP64_00115 [Burkholderiales bacterium]